MILRDEGLLCPYCGSVETEEKVDRDALAVYGCADCGRTFSAPQT